MAAETPLSQQSGSVISHSNCSSASCSSNKRLMYEDSTGKHQFVLFEGKNHNSFVCTRLCI